MTKHDIQLIRVENLCLYKGKKNAPVNQFKGANIVL